MAGATASATPTQPGGTGSVAQAGAMGSDGGTTTGTIACSSCCATQGLYLVSLFGGMGYVGSCPGALDNSQPFDLYFTVVLSLNSPYTAAQFCLPASFTITVRAASTLHAVVIVSSSCSVISPPSTQNTVSSSVYGYLYFLRGLGNDSYLDYFLIKMCSCDSSNMVGLGYVSTGPLTVVSCSPPSYSFSATVSIPGNGNIGTAAITLTF